jgi:hypothetical protein
MLPMIFILLLVTNYVASQAVYVASQGVTPSIHREALHRQAQVAVVPDNAFGIASSNRCWASATTLLVTEDHNVNENIDLMSFCSNMPDDVRKMLALEITKCHMHDVDQPVFIEDERDANICHEQINDSTLYVCMKRLTPSGAQFLAIFSNSVHVTCLRVIGDHFLKVNRERYNELTHQFAKLSAYTSRVEQALDEALHLQKLQRKSILNMPSKIVELVSNMTRNVVTDKIEIAFKEILKSELDISMWGLGVNISTMAGIHITTMLEEFFTQIENMQKKLNEGASRAKTFASSELKQLQEEHLPFLDDVKEFVSLAKTLAGSVEYFKNKYKDLQESFFTETKNLMDEVIELASRVKTSGPAEYLKNKYKDLLTLLGNIKRLLNPETYIS